MLSIIVSSMFSVCLTSCGDDDDEDVTTYTLKYSLDDSSSSLVDLSIFEYNEINESVNSNTLSEIKKGTNRQFTANERAVKVKVYLKMYSSKGTSTAIYRWVQNVFYLKKGGDTIIEIKNDTMVGSQEP